MLKSPSVHPIGWIVCAALAIFWIWFGTRLYWSIEDFRVKVTILAIPTMVWVMVTLFARNAEEPDFSRTVRPFWVLPRNMRFFVIVTAPAILVGYLLAYVTDVVGGQP